MILESWTPPGQSGSGLTQAHDCGLSGGAPEGSAHPDSEIVARPRAFQAGDRLVLRGSHRSPNPPACLSVRLPVCLPACLPACPPTRPPVHPLPARLLRAWCRAHASGLAGPGSASDPGLTSPGSRLQAHPGPELPGLVAPGSPGLRGPSPGLTAVGSGCRAHGLTQPGSPIRAHVSGLTYCIQTPSSRLRSGLLAAHRAHLSGLTSLELTENAGLAAHRAHSRLAGLTSPGSQRQGSRASWARSSPGSRLPGSRLPGSRLRAHVSGFTSPGSRIWAHREFRANGS